MQITLYINVQVKDGALVLTAPSGKTVSFSKEQAVQQKISMIILGELCDLPKRQLAAGFGFKPAFRMPQINLRNFCIKRPAR